MLIIASAFAITRFILNQLRNIDEGIGISGLGPGRGFGLPSAAGSLGGGIIENHLPARNATEVPRNTPVVITFKEPMRLSSLIRDWTDGGTPTDPSDDPDGLNDAVIKIFPTSSTVSAALRTADVRVRYTPDRKTFVLRPVNPIGSPTMEVGYTVKLLAGLSGLLREDGTPAFSGAFSSGYTWSFQVSRVMDITPPQIISVIPRSGGVYAPNIVVQSILVNRLILRRLSTTIDYGSFAESR